MPAEIIDLREYRRTHPTRRRDLEPEVVFVAALSWVTAWWLVVGIAAARAVGRAM